MTRLFSFSFVCACGAFGLLAGANVPTYVAKPVSPAEVAAAHNSRPLADESKTIERLASLEADAWIARGEVRGKVVFEETFEQGLDAARWQFDTALTARTDDGYGGYCVRFEPAPGVYNGVALRPAAYVRIEPNRQYALLFDMRVPEGGYPPLVRLDYFDEDRADLNSPDQFLTFGDKKQTSVFHHNAHVISPHRPADARYLKIAAFLSPNYDRPGMIDSVRVVDVTDLIQAKFARREGVLRERAAAGKQDVLVYCDDNLARSYPVLPDSADVPGLAGRTLKIIDFPGEKTRATAILWSKSAWQNVTVAFSDLRQQGPEGAVIPATCLSAQILKSHFQGASAPRGQGLSGGRLALVPELLLNDDSLVVPDCTHNRNLVKYQTAARTWYADINTIWSHNWAAMIPADDMPIRDAKTLQPFALRAALNKQLVITIRVPSDAKSGTYTGEARFTAANTPLATLPILLRVAPLALPKQAETIYSPNREYTMGLYVWGELAAQDRVLINQLRRSRTQLLNEYRTLVDYAIEDPIFIWTKETVFDDEAFRQHLTLVREAGFTTKKLHLGASGHIGNATNATDLAAMQARLKKAMATAREFAFDEVYFYGFDEERGKVLLSQRKAWAAARQIGARTMVSGYADHFEMVGGLLDLIVYADPEGTADPAQWHATGARIWKYNTPQTYCEDPGVLRRNYGLALWKRGFDGASTYCNFGNCTCWNDISGFLRQENGGERETFGRQIVIVYPTVDGVIPTSGLIGLEEGIKDVRIITALRQRQRKMRNRELGAWLDSCDFANGDLVKIRHEALLRLSKPQ